MARDTALVTELEYVKGGAVFQAATDIDFRCAPIEEEALAASVRAARCRAVVIGVTKYRAALYAALAEASGSKGSLIARFGVGHDGVDKAEARERGIAVTNTPGALDASVAELAFWLMGALLRNLAHEGQMRADRFGPPAGRELEGKTLGLLGFGGIGRRVARAAHFGFGMRVIAAGRRSLGECAAASGQGEREWLAAGGLEEYTPDVARVLRTADTVSVHMPFNATTDRFINRERLALMRSTALFINTSRGGLVDEDALYEALAGGAIAGAGLDVYRAEPYLPQSPEKDLRRLPNVVLTPHIGSNTAEANARMAAACVRKVRDFLAGRLDASQRVC